MSEVFHSTDARHACRRGAIGSTMGAYPRDTGSNPVEGNGHFFPSYRQLYLSSFFDTHTHTHHVHMCLSFAGHLLFILTHARTHTHMYTHKLLANRYWQIFLLRVRCTAPGPGGPQRVDACEWVKLSKCPFSLRHESGPSWFLSTSYHLPFLSQPKQYCSALPRQSSGQRNDRPNLLTYCPTKKPFRFFSFLSSVFGECPPTRSIG